MLILLYVCTPSDNVEYYEGRGWYSKATHIKDEEWANNPDNVKCTFIGFATKSIKSVVEFDDEEGVVISSYNAG